MRTRPEQDFLNFYVIYIIVIVIVIIVIVIIIVIIVISIFNITSAIIIIVMKNIARGTKGPRVLSPKLKKTCFQPKSFQINFSECIAFVPQMALLALVVNLATKHCLIDTIS